MCSSHRRDCKTSGGWGGWEYSRLLSLRKYELMGQHLLSEVALGTLCISQRPSVVCEYCRNLPLHVLYMDHFHFPDQSSIFTAWAGLFPVSGLAASGRTLPWYTSTEAYHINLLSPHLKETKLSWMVHTEFHWAAIKFLIGPVVLT